jgi:hypothetical protein
VQAPFSVLNGNFTLTKTDWLDCHPKLRGKFGDGGKNKKDGDKKDADKKDVSKDSKPDEKKKTLGKELKKKSRCYKLKVDSSKVGADKTVTVSRIRVGLSSLHKAHKIKKWNAKAAVKKEKEAQKKDGKLGTKESRAKLRTLYRKLIRMKTRRYRVVGGWQVTSTKTGKDGVKKTTTKKIPAIVIHLRSKDKSDTLEHVIPKLKQKKLLLATDGKKWVVVKSKYWRRRSVKNAIKNGKEKAKEIKKIIVNYSVVLD